MHFAGTKDTKICGASNVGCYNEANQKLFGEDVIDGLKNITARKFRENCCCLPACTTITYDADIERAAFDFTETLKSYHSPLSTSDRLDLIEKGMISITFIMNSLFTFLQLKAYVFQWFRFTSETTTWSHLNDLHFTHLRIFWPFVEDYWDYFWAFQHLASSNFYTISLFDYFGRFGNVNHKMQLFHLKESLTVFLLRYQTTEVVQNGQMVLGI